MKMKQISDTTLTFRWMGSGEWRLQTVTEEFFYAILDELGDARRAWWYTWYLNDKVDVFLYQSSKIDQNLILKIWRIYLDMEVIAQILRCRRTKNAIGAL